MPNFTVFIGGIDHSQLGHCSNHVLKTNIYLISRSGEKKH